MRFPALRLTVGAALLLAACSGQSPNSSSAATAAHTVAPSSASPSELATLLASPMVPTPTVREAPNASASAPTSSVSHCPFHGLLNHCLGPIVAGTYTTTEFTPQVTYTVPDGWTSFEDLPGNFLIGPPGATHDGIDPGLSDYLAVYTSIAAPLRDCRSLPDISVPPTAAKYAAWLRANPGLIATKPVPLKVDGRSGLSIDVALNAKANGLCSDPTQGIPAFAEVAIGQSPSDFSASVLSTVSVRLDVFDVNGHVMAILLSDTLEGGSDYPDFWSSAQPVVDSFKFATQ